MNSVAMNMAVQVSVWCADAASFRSLSRREQMGHMGVLASVFCFLLFLFQDRVSLLALAVPKLTL